MTVVYNRIPKCGSGSVNIFLTGAEERNRHQFCRSTLYSQRELATAAQRAKYAANPFVASSCRRRIDVGARAVLNRHVFFFDFGPERTAAPVAGGAAPASLAAPGSGVIHVNLLREPVSRCVSRFYYERDARGTVREGVTLDDCMGRGDAMCAFERFDARTGAVSSGLAGYSRARQLTEEGASNYLTRWFCGHDARCSPAAAALGLFGLAPDDGGGDPGDAARARRGLDMLELAAENLATKHAVVGLLGRMDDSLRLIGRAVPAFFGGAEEPAPCNKCNPNRTHVTNPPPNAVHRRILERVNVLDVALYEFAERVFDAKYAACFPAGSS